MCWDSLMSYCSTNPSSIRWSIVWGANTKKPPPSLCCPINLRVSTLDGFHSASVISGVPMVFRLRTNRLPCDPRACVSVPVLQRLALFRFRNNIGLILCAPCRNQKAIWFPRHGVRHQSPLLCNYVRSFPLSLLSDDAVVLGAGVGARTERQFRIFHHGVVRHPAVATNLRMNIEVMRGLVYGFGAGHGSYFSEMERQAQTAERVANITPLKSVSVLPFQNTTPQK